MTLDELLSMLDCLKREAGPAVVRYREEHGLTQQQLAERIGVSRRTVIRLESGECLSRAVLGRIRGM